MHRRARTLATALALLFATAGAAQGAIIGAPDFSASPFTKANVGAGNAVTGTLVWLPPVFSPVTANDKQTVAITDVAGGSTTASNVGGTAGSFPFILSDGRLYTFRVSACSTSGGAACDPASVGTTSNSVTTRIDATAPAGTLQINGGAVATNDRTVTLGLSASDPLIGGQPGTSSGVSQVAVDVDGNGTTPCIVFGGDVSGCAVAFAPSVTATIPPGPDGLKTMGVVYGDGARVNTAPCPPMMICAVLAGSFILGNVSDEPTDTILLDTVKPTAVATLDRTSLERGSAVTFTSGSSTDPGGALASGIDPAQTRWDFADGTAPATGAAATHTFSTAGTFIGRLTVRDRAGNVSDAGAFTVVVAPKPGDTVSGSGSIAGVTGTAQFSVSGLQVRARYARSRLKGSVKVTGSSIAAGSLRLVVRRGPKGKVLRAGSSRIGAAGFTRTVTLPATLTPGSYTLTLVGPGGTLSTVLKITPPREGVLRSAGVTASRAGAIARFAFAAQPNRALRKALAVTWSQGGKVLAVVPVGSAPRLVVRLRPAVALAKGPLTATLRARAIVVGSASARVR